MKGALHPVRALVSAALTICLCGATAHAGDVRTGLKFPSAALGAPMAYSLYLPDAYAAEPGRRFPVIYLLHGYGGDDRQWLEDGKADAVFDDLIGSGAIPPLIAVMPDAKESWYVDSAALGGPGDYETAIVRDLPDFIEKTYRAATGRGSRLIAGLSMGGYGALRFAFFHPDRYVAVASLSGAIFQGVGIPGVSRPTPEALDEAETWFHGAYGRPFDPAIYMARNPFSRVAALGALREPPSVFITCGDDDFFRFYEGASALFIALRQAGLPVELRIDDGGHDWSVWRREFPEVMRFLAQTLKGSEPK